ncbi:septum formation initiator family protein [bacterium]|nr:MAG: septum formation initiator family protein [bacterium]
MKLPKIFYNKFFLGAMILVFLFSALLEYNQYRQRHKIDTEIAMLKQQEQELQASNRQLEQSINFLSSPEYQDKLARLQLNLKKEGEIVINIPQQQAEQNGGAGGHSPKSNLIKWWEYIFIN